MVQLEAAAREARPIIRRLDRFTATWEAQGFIPWEASISIEGKLLAALLDRDELTIRGKIPTKPQR
jgi:hypothetical protein